MNFGNLITREEMYNKLDLLVSKIKSISVNKNILIITHDDLDGFVSAYCFEKYFLSLGFIVDTHSISYEQIHYFDSYCSKLDFEDKVIIILDKFDTEFITKFEGKNYFIIDHHEGAKHNFINENMINIANYFKTDVVPSMGAYSYGYTKTKNVDYPIWFSFVARITDGTYESNEFFIPITEEEKEVNYFMGLPRAEIMDFVEFINTFFNNPLEIKDLYFVFRECIDSGNTFHYFFADSQDLIYLRNLKKEITKTKDKLLKKCLTKHKKYEKERLILFYLTEKENGARRLIQNKLESAFLGYNTLILIKLKNEYVISYRTNTTKFNVLKHLKPIYDEYCKFGGHPFAAAGVMKSEFKKKFMKDTLTYLKKYYANNK